LTPKTQINLSSFSRDEVLSVIRSQCSNFDMIPQAEQWTMALYAMGGSYESIASMLDRKTEDIANVVERFKSFLSTLPDDAKARICQRLLWNSIGTYVAVMTDKRKIDSLSPDDAMKILKEIPKLQRELMELESVFIEHQSRMATLNFDAFGKSLGEKK
jgi:hypothetical protein